MTKINDPDHDGRIAANDNKRLNAFEELNKAVFGDKFSELRRAILSKKTPMSSAETHRKFLNLIGIHNDFDTESLSWDERKSQFNAMLPKDHPWRDTPLEEVRNMHILNAVARLYENTLGEKSDDKENVPQAREALVACIKSYLNPFQAKRMVAQFTKQIEEQKAKGATLE